MNAEHITQTIINLNNDTIIFKGIEINSILVENQLWVKGTNITKILGYKNINNPITENLQDRHKKILGDLIKVGLPKSRSHKLNSNINLSKLTNNERNTIYINESGIYRILLKSRLPIAEELQVWLEDEVLPQIRKSGSYSIQCNNLIENDNNEEQIFWTENSISDYDNKNVLYLGFIGINDNGEPLFKFGKSEQVYTREFEQHQRTFDKFQMRHIELCDNMSIVEKEFKKELKTKNLLRTLEINGKNQTELFTITPQNDINKIILILKDLIIKYPLQVVKDSKEEIEKIRYIYENDKLNLEIDKLNIEIKYLKRENENIMEAINKIQKLIKNNSHITELDINPLIVNDKEYIVADARIVMK